MRKKLIIGIGLLVAIAIGLSTMTPTTVEAKKKKKKEKAEEVQLPYPPCKGPKKRIAIYRFKDGVNNNISSTIKGGLAEALQYELQQTGCFVVLVTNEDMSDAAAEIGHGQSGMATEGRSPQAGKQLGAQMLVQGVLYEVSYTGGKGGTVKVPGRLTGGIGGNVGMSKQEAKVVIMVKMFDPETRILAHSEKAEGYVVKRKVKAGVSVEGVMVGGKFDKETPLGDAALRAIHKAVYIILTKSNEMPWQASVLKVTGKRVLIRGGSDSGLQVGMVLNVYKPGEKIEDPDTGEVLSEPATKLGQVKVTQVMSKMSYCEIVSGPVTRGMWVRLE